MKTSYHTVTVTAADPWGLREADDPLSATTQEVTITIGNVNEAPRITGGPTKTKQKENATATVTVADGTQPVTTYRATDPESDLDGDICSDCIWSVSGPDAAVFSIVESGTALEAVAQFTFKKAPNYEKPADSDEDNIYMVTVVVTDKGIDTPRKLGVDKLTATGTWSLPSPMRTIWEL